MPLYDVKCQACGERDTVFRKVDDRDNLPECPCGGELQRLISAPMLAPVWIPAFVSPGTGKLVDSRTQYRDDLKRSGAIPWEPGLKEQIARNRKDAQEKSFAPLSKAVDEYITAAVSAGRLET